MQRSESASFLGLRSHANSPFTRRLAALIFPDGLILNLNQTRNSRDCNNRSHVRVERLVRISPFPPRSMNAPPADLTNSGKLLPANGEIG